MKSTAPIFTALLAGAFLWNKFMTSSVKKSCENCMFFTSILNKNDITLKQGVCRRYPPLTQIIPTMGGRVGKAINYVEVKADGWCGEHQLLNAEVVK